MQHESSGTRSGSHRIGDRAELCAASFSTCTQPVARHMANASSAKQAEHHIRSHARCTGSRYGHASSDVRKQTGCAPFRADIRSSWLRGARPQTALLYSLSLRNLPNIDLTLAVNSFDHRLLCNAHQQTPRHTQRHTQQHTRPRSSASHNHRQTARRTHSLGKCSAATC